MRDMSDYRVSPDLGMGLQVPSHREGTLHLGRLEFPLRPFPVSVDVGCHLERRVTEMARQPSDLRTCLEPQLSAPPRRLRGSPRRRESLPVVDLSPAP